MTIWAIKGPSEEEELEFVMHSLAKGKSRFGWGWADADLHVLNEKAFSEMTASEQKAWDYAHRLLEIEPGDWVVHINVPDYGLCTAGQVAEAYAFEKEDTEISDFRHYLKLEPNTVLTFDRNDPNVLPVVSARLKLPGRYYRIGYSEEFLQSLENVKAKAIQLQNNQTVGLLHLKNDLASFYRDITVRIQKTHPRGSLEGLIAEVFKNVPGVTAVHPTGQTKGYGTDHGADLVVEYRAGLPIGPLEKQDKLVVQVKSYVDDHHEVEAVRQIANGMEHYQASSGLLVTTGTATKALENAIDDLQNSMGKPIGLIAGEDVAKFVLRFGGSLII